MSTPKSMVRAVGKELAALPQIQEILKKYGLTSAVYAGGTIKDGSFNVRIEFTHEVEEGDVIQTAPPAFTKSMFGDKFAQHGLPNDIIGKHVTLNRSVFTIVDVKSQNAQGSLRKCVIIEGSGGGRYVTTAMNIKRALGIGVIGVLTQRPVPQELMQNPLSPELCAKFTALAGQLSPENLSCDGELNRIQQGMRKSQIMREWQALEALAGRKVGENEFPY